MKKFTKLISTALPLRTENIDTDQIIPAIFLKTTKKEGLGKYLFYNWRFDEKGRKKKNNIFTNDKYKGAKILVTGNNFGCGSSREHAVWSLQDYGFKAIISSSFGDIFYNNALKNGLLPVIIKPPELKKLFEVIEKNPKTELTIDLKKQIISFHNSPLPAGRQAISLFYLKRELRGVTTFHFPIDQFRKTCLLKGVDELEYILSQELQIKAFERSHKIFLYR